MLEDNLNVLELSYRLKWFICRILSVLIGGYYLTVFFIYPKYIILFEFSNSSYFNV